MKSRHRGGRRRRLRPTRSGPRQDEQTESLAEFPWENPHPLLRLGRGGEVLFANDRAAALLEENGHKGELLPKDLLAAAEEALHTGQAGEVQVECADKLLFSFFCAPVPAKGYVNLYGRDVTEMVHTAQALRGSNRRLRLLADLAEQLWGAHAPVDAASSAFRMIAGELELHAYFIYLIEPDGSLRLDSWSGIPGEVAGGISHLKPGEAICGLVARSGQPIHATHVQSSAETRVEFVRRCGFRAYYCHPLLVQNRLFGTLSFGTNSRDQFSPEELDFIRTVVRYVVLANERLQAERERRLIAEERERLLRQSQQWSAELDAIIKAIAAPLIIYNLQGGIVRMNPTAENLLSHTPELRAMPVAERTKGFRVEATDGSPLPMEQWPVNRALRGETVSGEIVKVEAPSGRAIWGSVSAAPIRTPEGETLGAVLTFVDITPMHDLQQAREMYVHTISHDLRTPLTVILGYAQLLPTLYREEGVQPHIEAILKSAERMNRMIEDLVEAARLEGGEVALEIQSIRLDQFLPEFLQRSSTALDISRIVTEVPALPPVAADPSRLERILTNLLTNALKYSSPETLVEVRARQDGPALVVSVHDHGQGIDPDDLPHIFDRFYRPQGGRKSGSVGLGLYITRSLVEAHGGQIRAESTPGVGSEFYFTLPLNSA